MYRFPWVCTHGENHTPLRGFLNAKKRRAFHKSKKNRGAVYEYKRGCKPTENAISQIQEKPRSGV